MSGTNNDPTDWQLTVDDQIIRGFNLITGFNLDQEGSRITAPGRVTRGFNKSRGANGVTFTIVMDQTSPDIEILRNLAKTQKTIRVAAEIVRNLSDYEIGQEKALGAASAILNKQSHDPVAEEAGTIEFAVEGFDPIEEYFTE